MTLNEGQKATLTKAMVAAGVLGMAHAANAAESVYNAGSSDKYVAEFLEGAGKGVAPGGKADGGIEFTQRETGADGRWDEHKHKEGVDILRQGKGDQVEMEITLGAKGAGSGWVKTDSGKMQMSWPERGAGNEGQKAGKTVVAVAEAGKVQGEAAKRSQEYERGSLESRDPIIADLP